MPNRYSLNLRPRWRDDEPTGGELIQEGIGDAIGSYLKIRGANQDFEDQVSMAGGTIDPQPTWRDRLNKLNPFGGGQRPMTPDQIQQGMAQRQVRPALVEDTRSTGIRLPTGVTPITDQGAHMDGGQWVLGGKSPSRGISGALRPLYDTNSHNYPNQTAETYTKHGPNGQVARIPFISPREIAAAEAGQRAKRSEFEYEQRFKTDEEIRKERETAPYKTSGGLTFEQRQQLAREDDDRYLRNRQTLEGMQHSNTLSEIDRRGRYRSDGDGGEGSGIDSKATSRGNGLISAGQKLMSEAKDDMGVITDQQKYARGQRLMDQGARMLGEEPAPSEFKRAPSKQTPETARAAAAEILADAQRRFPNASPQAHKNYVRNVMKKAGWKVQ